MGRKVRLINTIEILPSEYSDQEYEYPDGNDSNYTIAWEDFWVKSLRSKKLENLKSIEAGSFLVDISSIEINELEEIVKNKLENFSLENWKEEVQMCGGIAIQVNNEFPIRAQCCGDLGDLSGWESIINEATEEWQFLWIGHPGVFYRTKNSNIEFSTYYEDGNQNGKDITPILSLVVNEFEKEICKVKNEQVKFGERVRKVLEKMKVKNAKQIAQVITQPC